MVTLSNLGSVPALLTPPSRRAKLVLRAKWIGTRPRRSSTSTRIRLAEGVWIVPERNYGYSQPEWMKEGLCTQLSTEDSDPLFFGVEHRMAPEQLIAAANEARQICSLCPVAAICLTNALVGDERYGIWGGTSGRQRAKMRTRLLAGAGVDELVRECLSPEKVSA